MKILINTKEENLKRFSKFTTIRFESLNASDINEAVAVVLQDDNYESNLNKALALDIPIATVAGHDGHENHLYALEAGIPEEAILVVQDGWLTNQGDFKYPAKKGLKLQELTEFSKYVYDNKLMPEIYVWLIPDIDDDSEDIEVWNIKDNVPEVPQVKPEERTEEKPADIDPEFRIVIREETEQPDQINEKDNPAKSNQIIQVSAEDFVGRYKKVIAILKTDPKVNGGSTIKKIAANLNGFHLEMTENPVSHKCYAEPIEKAVQLSNYGYLKGPATVITSSMSAPGALIMEVDTTDNNALNLLESIMPHITYIFHLTGEFDANKQEIDTWMSMKLPLHGILPTKDENKYRKEYMDLVKTIQEISDM